MTIISLTLSCAQHVDSFQLHENDDFFLMPSFSHVMLTFSGKGSAGIRKGGVGLECVCAHVRLLF